jgi:hypothetical protein
VQIDPGTPVQAVNALGDRVDLVAATGIVAGADFAVVWVCEADEWARALGGGRDPEAVPWPAEAIRAARPPGAEAV